MKKQTARISSRRSARTKCPNCARRLDAVTGAEFGPGSEPARPVCLKGLHTICAYCAEMLIFADNAGRVRPMTEAEKRSAKFPAAVRRLYEQCREKVRSDAERLTRTGYN